MSGFVDGVIDRAELVNQAYLDGICAGPHTTLSDAVHLRHSHLAAIGHTLGESAVYVFNRFLHHHQLGFIHRAETCAIIRMFVGFHAVNSDTQFVFERILERRNHAKHADGAGKCIGLCDDVVGVAGDVIAAGGSVVTHGGYHHFASLLGFLNFLPDILRSQGTAARRIDSQHDSLHIFVIVCFFEFFDKAFGVDTLTIVAFAVFDIAYGIHDCYFVRNFTIIILDALLVFFNRDKIEIFIFRHVEFVFQQFFHVAGEADFIHQFQSQRILRQGAEQIVGDGIQGICRNFARCGDVTDEHIPQRVGQKRQLLAVSLAHLIQNVGLHGTLELSVTHYLHIHIQFVDEAFVKHNLHGIALEIQRTCGVEDDFVGHRCQIIAVLRIDIAISVDELAGFLELKQGIVNLLNRRGGSGHGSGIDVNAFDLGIGGCVLDRGQHVVQAYLTVIVVEHLERHIHCTLGHTLGQIDFQNAVILHTG